VSVHVEEAQADLAADLLLADEVEAAFVPCGPAVVDDLQPARRLRRGDGVEVLPSPEDDLDLRPFDYAAAGEESHRLVSRKRRALAAFAALMVAGAPVLAHFVS
jgi:hypothetical protein